MKIRSMVVIMDHLHMGMEVGVIPARCHYSIPTRMGMVMVPVIMPVPVIMYQGEMSMGVAVVFCHQDDDPGEHQDECREKYQAGRIPEDKQSDDDAEDR